MDKKAPDKIIAWCDTIGPSWIMSSGECPPRMNTEEYLLATPIRKNAEGMAETNKRLNRKCQKLESAVLEKAENSGPSMGRHLANASAMLYKNRVDKLQRALYRAVYKTSDGSIREGRELLEELE